MEKKYLRREQKRQTALAPRKVLEYSGWDHSVGEKDLEASPEVEGKF
ncbi:MAG TPA: hypothetical protein PK777_12380 [Thermoguttaceae bacterium]|nr:hypothetical protein [Thermoguttaceae bacterium]